MQGLRRGNFVYARFTQGLRKVYARFKQGLGGWGLITRVRKPCVKQFTQGLHKVYAEGNLLMVNSSSIDCPCFDSSILLPDSGSFFSDDDALGMDAHKVA
jgi:hypothetical protein